MKFPRLPSWPLEVDDSIALLGLVAIAVGTWSKYGPAEAAILDGTLLLLGYTVHEVFALLRRPRG